MLWKKHKNRNQNRSWQQVVTEITSKKIHKNLLKSCDSKYLIFIDKKIMNFEKLSNDSASLESTPRDLQLMNSLLFLSFFSIIHSCNKKMNKQTRVLANSLLTSNKKKEINYKLEYVMTKISYPRSTWR